MPASKNPATISDIRSLRDEDPDLALRLAARDGDLDFLRALLASGANPDAQDSLGFTALMCAAYNGRAKCAQELLPVSDLAKRTIAHQASPLALAAGSELPTAECLGVLLPYFDFNEPDATGCTPLMLAARSANADCVAALLGSCDPGRARPFDGQTALMLAAAKGSVDCVAALAARSDSDAINARDVDGANALRWAASEGHADCVRALIEAHCDARSVALDGQTPFACAMRFAHFECALALLHCSDVNATDRDGQTPLMLFAANTHGFFKLDAQDEAALRQIAAQADLSKKDSQGKTFARLCLESRSAAPLDALSDFLPHSDVSFCARYFDPQSAPKIHARKKALDEAAELGRLVQADVSKGGLTRQKTPKRRL